MSLTAASANVSQPGNPIQINVLRWSTEEERRLVVAALNPPPPPSAPPVASSASSGAPPPAAAGGDARRAEGVAAPDAEVAGEGAARRPLHSIPSPR